MTSASTTERFNSFDGSHHHAGPRPGPTVPDAHQNLNLHYDIDQILNAAQKSAIQNHRVMAFHCLGDSGTDDHHNGNDKTREAVARLMEAQCEAAKGTPQAPCLCYHVGDVIYPHGDEARYEAEFYQPYSIYRNAIVAIPGNHDYYGDHLGSFQQNFLQPTLKKTPGTRPAMNLPWFYWVLDTPVATIISLGAVSNYITHQQREWFKREMQAADTAKALIVAVHYPPYCFDGSDNSAIRHCIQDGINTSNRTPDLVISGHAHNYQRIEGPYPVLVVGTGGVGTSQVNKYSGGNGARLIASNDQVYGALTLVVDANNRTIKGSFNIAATTSGSAPANPAFDSFSYNWTS